MRLLSLPDEFSFVLIQLVPKFVTGFDHQFVKVMAKFRVKWHKNSLIPFSEDRIAKTTKAANILSLVLYGPLTIPESNLIDLFIA
jgi:hypothetical protein